MVNSWLPLPLVPVRKGLPLKLLASLPDGDVANLRREEPHLNGDCHIGQSSDFSETSTISSNVD